MNTGAKADELVSLPLVCELLIGKDDVPQHQETSNFIPNISIIKFTGRPAYTLNRGDENVRRYTARYGVTITARYGVTMFRVCLADAHAM